MGITKFTDGCRLEGCTFHHSEVVKPNWRALAEESLTHLLASEWTLDGWQNGLECATCLGRKPGESGLTVEQREEIALAPEGHALDCRVATHIAKLRRALEG